MSRQSFIGVERGEAETVTLETTGRVIRPFLQAVGRLADECKLRVGPDGLRVRVVDPANVGAVELQASAEAFGSADLPDEETVIGMNLEYLQGRLRKARMGSGTADAVTIRMDDAHTETEVRREYGDTALVISDEWLNINPKSIRQEFEPPGLDLPWQAEIDAQAFTQAVTAITSHYSHVTLQEHDGDMVMSGAETDTKDGDEKTIEGSAATFYDVVESGEADGEGGETSIYSQDYIEDIAYGIKKAKAETTTIRWGEEFPIMADFERVEDGTELYSGTYMVAPRISS